MAEKPSPRPAWEYYTTVSYRTVFLLAAGVLTVAIVALAILYPEIFSRAWAMLKGSGEQATAVNRSFSARFTNLEGSVRVKKRDAVQWTDATLGMPLEAGDTIQTGSNGTARVQFLDGTIYTVKADTLIIIERNTALEDRSTQVAVQVSSGSVDLSTGSWELASSVSEVRLDQMVARMQQNTRAAVRQDPEANIHEITVAEGGATVSKGKESIQIGPYERASYRDPAAPINTEKILAPPQLVRPRNLEPIITATPAREVIQFEWNPVPKARSYRLRVSTSPLFATTVIDRKLADTSFSARGFQPGDYYWTVSASDDKGQQSQEGAPNRFTLAPQPATEQLLLVIENMVQHGRVIEIVGRTEPGATVTVNAEPVAYVGPDGGFRHFTKPLPEAGAHKITVVAQNLRGEVVTRTKVIYVK
ncbi:MAG: FecR domain-containing protein [Acidobacteria bacterium]|nr:FecR domain-containing protein [Acidobacteriota bacterium]